MDPRYAEVVGTLATYFDGLYHSDRARLTRVFHPEARYLCASDGALLNLGMADYFRIVDDRPAPAGRNELRRDRIVSLEFAGPVTAFARLECAIGPKDFTDFLTLVFIDGKWQIIAKVFHFDLRDAVTKDPKC